MEENSIWYSIIIIVFILWGTQHPPIKILSENVPPFLLNFLRFSIALIAMIPFVLHQRDIPNLKDMFFICSLGVIGISLYGLLVVEGIRFSTAINSAILINANPILIAILAPFLIKEKLNWKKNIGILLGFAGVLVTISNGLNFQGLKSEYFTGNILLILAALCVALYAIYNKLYIEKYGGLVTTFWAVLGGTIVLFFITILNGEINQILSVTFESYLLIAYVAIITTALTWIMWFNAIKKIGVIKTGTFFFLIPISGIVSSNLILGESLTFSVLLGTLMIITAIYVVHKN